MSTEVLDVGMGWMWDGRWWREGLYIKTYQIQTINA